MTKLMDVKSRVNVQLNLHKHVDSWKQITMMKRLSERLLDVHLSKQIRVSSVELVEDAFKRWLSESQARMNSLQLHRPWMQAEIIKRWWTKVEDLKRVQVILQRSTEQHILSSTFFSYREFVDTQMRIFFQSCLNFFPSSSQPRTPREVNQLLEGINVAFRGIPEESPAVTTCSLLHPVPHAFAEKVALHKCEKELALLKAQCQILRSQQGKEKKPTTG
ncbi:hypothetical protein GUITHDRAFT_141091 [Guillardia theta CCMP2712]|uniref:Uncharacterized protein n=1 Tax=Guillardia theta (strain CCMP2712) TaxID=905079 RepID=L1J2D9_GUITC|nr:hypothetical protein GUITHDRAFT_141091 [Guillardia theta CCMP2712]EKX42691.1 hypothetical protein GUITHDRAFT_141091 [Guillardia theta CCMP2712]|eukprot:XP_005829671.1 hypothetical protein GUITHDRAFT_141091 [Guillardia theta CCMP2712]